MKEKLIEIINKHSSLAEQMADPEVFGDQEKLTSIAKEHSSLEDLVKVSKRYIKVLDLIIDDKSIYFKKTWYTDIDNYLIKKKDK